MKQLTVILGLVATLALIVGSSPAGADELTERDALTNECFMMFAAQRLSELNAVLDSLNTQLSRTPAGTFKLNICMFSLDNAGTSPRPESVVWRLDQSKLEEHIAAHPEEIHIPLVLALMTRAHAWRYRGTGAVSSVPAANLAQFRRLIDQERDILERSKTRSSANPEWYVLRFLVLRESRHDNVDVWSLLDEASHRFPNYYPIYTHAADAVDPRWGGSIRDVERIAEYGTRAAVGEGISVLARVYSHFPEGSVVDRVTLDRVALSQSIDDLIMRFPDEWNYNLYAKLACRAKMAAQTKKLLLLAKSPSPWKLWGGPANEAHNRFEECRVFSGADRNY